MRATPLPTTPRPIRPMPTRERWEAMLGPLAGFFDEDLQDGVDLAFVQVSYRLCLLPQLREPVLEGPVAELGPLLGISVPVSLALQQIDDGGALRCLDDAR